MLLLFFCFWFCFCRKLHLNNKCKEILCFHRIFVIYEKSEKGAWLVPFPCRFALLTFAIREMKPHLLAHLKMNECINWNYVYVHSCMCLLPFCLKQHPTRTFLFLKWYNFTKTLSLLLHSHNILLYYKTLMIIIVVTDII